LNCAGVPRRTSLEEPEDAMPDLHLTEREQNLLRTLMAAEPVPGSPIPETHVLELIAALIGCDTVGVGVRRNQGPVLALSDLPGSGDGNPEDHAVDTWHLGLVHLSRDPLIAASCGALEGRVDAVWIGFRNGPDAVAQIDFGRHKRLFSDRDIARVRLLSPVLERHLRTRITTRLPAALTVQERRVLNYVSAGLTNREIAGEMFVAPSTVRKHLEHAYPKLGVTNRLAAAVAVRGTALTPADEPGRFELAERLA